MLQIKNIRFLSKIYTPFDSITSPVSFSDTQSIVLKVTFDEQFSFPDAKGETTKNQTAWSEEAFPHVELSSKQDYYNVKFTIYKNKIEVGCAKTIVGYGRNIKGT